MIDANTDILVAIDEIKQNIALVATDLQTTNSLLERLVALCKKHSDMIDTLVRINESLTNTSNSSERNNVH